MHTTTFLKISTASATIALLLAAGAAFADHDNKGGGDRGSGGDKSVGSSKSFSGGSDRSSSRSVFKSSDNDRNSDNRSTYRSGKNSGDSGQQFLKSFKSDQSGSQFKQGSREYQTRRPSDDQVQNFLKSKGNDNAAKFRDRNPQEREFVDREFNQWRNTWSGDKNDKNDKGNHDHRDWSGNWKNSDRFSVADHIRRDWHDRKDNDRIFGGDWWHDRHRGNYWRFWGDYALNNHRPWYWWSWANGPRLGSWFVFGWPTPYYWDYGPGEYIYYDNGAIYVNGRWYQPAPVFYDQTVRIIDQAPDLSADAAAKLEWLPLGVFAATPDGVNEPEVIVQLAVTKDGVIGGTAFDQKGGNAFAIEGMVDKRSQRAVWSYTNDRNKRIVMETSVYNLTQPEATGLVHYGPTDMRVIELVRLEQPGADSSGATPLPAPPVAQ